MINIDNLTFTYPGAGEPTLNNVMLHVEESDFLAIMGNNGSGKSTLCKTLNGLIPHFIAGDMEGTVEINRLNTKEQEIGILAKKVGYVYQDFENQIVCPTVLEDASYACLNYAMKDYKQKGREALEVCGLSQKADDYVWQMSGGQKHLLALAGVTALSPDILILDEPIAQLDPVHAKRIYEVLRELNVKYHKTIIVIEHHTEYIAKYCKNAVLIRNGGVVWKLPAKEALRRVGELQESNIFPPQVTIAADKMVKMGILPYDTILPVNIDEGKRVFEPYILNKEYRSQPCSLENNNNQMVVFQNVEVQYRAVKGDPVKILDNFNLEIKRGQKIALVGSNGAGKSTLLKLMMGLLKPSDGKVLIDNMNTKEMTPEKLSRIISLVYQNPEEMFIKDSIRGDIAYAMKARKVEDYEKRTQELLETFHLAELSERDGRLLSGGQMRRASLAIGIALNPGILLLDEPTANLDIATRKEIMKTLQVLKDVTDTVVIATHDMQLVCEWAERIIVLNAGCIIADGKREEIFSDNDVRELVGIRPPEIFEMGTSLGLSNKYFTIDDFLGCFERRAL